ncbi:hypothetical protein HK097_009426 [Rhizophlyctis rosea]|uniref:Ribosomal protein n=1 Tax=Rhizophlyctis rosea TaxID=64517 RepID=A0AAD5S8Y9_9FUNG|nr:hypothetical protein HK097_009426 [Rhizophlyctis rosea]
MAAHVQVPAPTEGVRPLRGEVALPKGLSSEDTSVILVFAKGAQAEEAKKLGAHIVGAEELIQEILADRVKFDKVLSTREMFPQVVKIARVLGPKGLMPSPAKGTVSDDLPAMMANLQATSKFEVDQHGYVHLDIARTAWTDSEILTNITTFVKAVRAARPPKTDESKFVESINISAEYAPGLKLPPQIFAVAKEKGSKK